MSIFLLSIISGLSGTFAMTSFLYLLSYVLNKNLKVVAILGTMITNTTKANGELSKSRKAVATGMVSHYLIGIALAFVFQIILAFGFPLNYSTGMLYGAILGVVAATTWTLFLKLHPHPPLVPLKTYLLSIVVGHIIFGFSITFVSMIFQGS